MDRRTAPRGGVVIRWIIGSGEMDRSRRSLCRLGRTACYRRDRSGRHPRPADCERQRRSGGSFGDQAAADDAAGRRCGLRGLRISAFVAGDGRVRLFARSRPHARGRVRRAGNGHAHHRCRQREMRQHREAHHQEAEQPARRPATLPPPPRSVCALRPGMHHCVVIFRTRSCHDRGDDPDFRAKRICLPCPRA